MEDYRSRKTIIFLVFQEIITTEGISKKIIAQKEGFENQGYRCLLGRIVTDKEGNTSYYIGEDKVQESDYYTHLTLPKNSRV